MLDMNKMREAARNAAAADIFSYMASEEKSNELLGQIKALPDTLLDLMARASGVPEEHFHIHRAMVRGKDNVFMKELEDVDGLLHVGDVILMTGNRDAAQSLVNLQKKTYPQARSSHVALVHADFVCIDAMPKLGASHRIISQVLSDVHDDWRIIRYKGLQERHRDSISRACTFYLAQPYKIWPSRKSAKNYAYCSELARKVYRDSNILGTGISNSPIIKPADFDRLADQHSEWQDVTEVARPAVEFCRKYPQLVLVASKLFIDGLKLNRQRFEDRKAEIAKLQLAAKHGLISREAAFKQIKLIRDIERDLHHTFWDVPRK